MADTDQITTDLIKDTIAAYDAEIAYADWAVGKLLDKLEQLHLNKNTMVVAVSDHGESLGELLQRYGYAFGHGEFLYATQLHIPLIIRLPAKNSSKKGLVHADPVSIIDIMPTILKLLKIKPTSTIAGDSLLPIMREKSVTHNAVFSERRSFETVPQPYLRGTDSSIIDRKHHLIFSTIRDSELYDLIDDPGEISDLRGVCDQTEILTEKLQTWRNDYRPLFKRPGFEEEEEIIQRIRSLGYVR